MGELQSEGGLHIGLDQSGTEIEGDFQKEKSDTPQSAAELDVNEQSVSTNTQSVTKENVLTVAENLSLAGETSEAQATQFVYWDDLIRQIGLKLRFLS